MVSTRSSTKMSKANLAKPMKAKAGKDIPTQQRADMPNFEVDRTVVIQPVVEVPVKARDAANVLVVGPHPDMTAANNVTADDTEADRNIGIEKANFNIDVDGNDTSNMQVAVNDPFMPLCEVTNDDCEFWDDDYQESKEEVIAAEWVVINSDLDTHTQNIHVGGSDTPTPIVGAATLEFWDSDHQESKGESMAATCDMLSSRIEVRLGDFLSFETIPGRPVSETSYILSGNTAIGVEMVFRNMLELFYVIPSIRKLLLAIRNGGESNYTQFILSKTLAISEP
jgi:hypothetical protein